MAPSPAPATTQIFLASTLYGAATLAAALDAGCFGPADRRLLLVSNNAAIPETTPGPDRMPGFAELAARFDAVLDWNATIEPFHPGGWLPRPDDAPLWERQLRTLWELGEDRVELVVESIQVAPAQAVVQLFPGAPIEVYADGLMSYGPTRNKLDPAIGGRIRRLLHLDLVPGLEPLLLTEFGVPAELVPAAAFLDVLASLPVDEAELAGIGEAPALLLGQYLSAIELLTPQEEEELHVRMVRGAHALGHRELVFKPHPSAPARWSRMVEEEAARLGARLTVLDTPVLAEVLYRRLAPALVAGCFSTGLLTAATLFGIPVARTGTAPLLDRVTPYQNSNRVPLTIVDALLPELSDPEAVRAWSPPGPAAVKELAALVTAVGYAMQSQILAARRPEAERFLAHHLDERVWRYFKRRRLTALGLPGAVPAQLAFIPRSPTVKRVVRRVRHLRRTALG
ncbi:polysialyltransferase family glycosyltransferase [Streptomyces sp. NPDC089919]|uniref:polysialyltransferase family glycosyltransferase n=1 Tax=Streptomyces sp. NPDC089919 TaxID=3155188 RepID=UPI00343FACCF